MRRRLVFAIPGDLDLATGGYGYDRRMIAELRELGWEVEILPLPDAFPAPAPGDLAAAAECLAALPDGTLTLVDGLAFGAMDEIAARQADRLRLAALVHHPLALETGLSAERAAELGASERRALRAARLVVATSRTTARTLEHDFAVPAGRLLVAPPGTEAGPPASGEGAPPRLVCVGTLTRRKGQDVLVDALSRLTDLDWHCRLVGDAGRDRDFAAEIEAAIAEGGLGERIAICGQVTDARAEMAGADLFVLPTRHEGYGMVFAEAMSQGLPVVGCAVGAVPEVVPEDAGLLVPPDDPEALGNALRALLADPELRREKAVGARRAGERLPDWKSSARMVSDALEGLGA